MGLQKCFRLFGRFLFTSLICPAPRAGALVQGCGRSSLSVLGEDAGLACRRGGEVASVPPPELCRGGRPCPHQTGLAYMGWAEEDTVEIRGHGRGCFIRLLSALRLGAKNSQVQSS